MLSLLMVLTVSLAGCNVKDWYDQVGTVRLELQVVGPDGSDIENLESVRVAIRSAQMRQELAVNPETSTEATAEVLDFATLAQTGERVLLLEKKVTMRGFESLNVKLEVLEALGAAGETIPGCEQGQRIENPPCVRYARDGAYPQLLDPTQFHVPRGGEMTVVLPIAVMYDAASNEYYLKAERAFHERS